ncbi:hypothetical protein TSUD_215840 [Trifolium subterraneum]|nr:hypothetical protein TSUD_215840 [Trifolium subterraneum]
MAIEGEEGFDDIISINHSSTEGRFEIRVVRKWGVLDYSRLGVFESVEMVLMDKHSHKIQANIPNDLLSVFDAQVQEGRVYVISDFTVRLNAGHSLSTYHRYVLFFNENTNVVPSDNHMIPTYGLCLIGADNVLEKKENFKYLVDVVGVVSTVQHDKNFYSDRRVTRSVTFSLNDQRKSFLCELPGELDEEFKAKIKCCTDGPPIVVLQFARIVISQGAGSVMVEGVERVTKILVNPNVAEVINFRNGLLLYLGRSRNYGGLIRAKQRLRFSHNLDFINDHPVKSIAELNTDPQLGVFIVNASMVDIVSLDPWWFPMCKCGEVFEDYIGGFHRTKCNLVQFKVVPKVKLTVELEDESGCARIKVFDHLMADLAVIDPDARNLAIIDYFKEKGLYKTPSKVVEKTLLSDKKGKKTINCLPFTTTTSDMVDQYFYAAFPLPSQHDPGSSSGLKRQRI